MKLLPITVLLSLFLVIGCSPMPDNPLYNEALSFKTFDGDTANLKDHVGKVVLVVNVASRCGLTPQYQGLQELQKKYGNRGFTVVAFPANDFLGQEPGSNEEIQEFCSTKFKVTFPVYAKISVKGETIHPLYTQLINLKPKALEVDEGKFKEMLVKRGFSSGTGSGILWNFEKFLLGREGNVVERFSPRVTPMNAVITDAIEAQLK